MASRKQRKDKVIKINERKLVDLREFIAKKKGGETSKVHKDAILQMDVLLMRS